MTFDIQLPPEWPRLPASITAADPDVTPTERAIAAEQVERGANGRGPTGKRGKTLTRVAPRVRGDRERAVAHADNQRKVNKRQQDYEEWVIKIVAARERGETFLAIETAMHKGMVPETNMFRYRRVGAIRSALRAYNHDTVSRTENRESEMRRVIRRISAVTAALQWREEAGIPVIEDYTDLIKVFVPLERLYMDLGGLAGAKDAEYMAQDARQAAIEVEQYTRFTMTPAQPKSIQRVEAFLAWKAELGQRTIDPAVVKRVMERQFGETEMVEVGPGLYVPGETGIDLAPHVDGRALVDRMADAAGDAPTAERALQVFGPAVEPEQPESDEDERAAP